MALIYNPCAEYKFNSGANPCSFEPGKVRGLIFHDKNIDWSNALTPSTEAYLVKGAHKGRPNRLYPVGGVIAYEGSGGEAQTSQVGYGSTRITGYSEKQMTFTLDERSQNLLASIVKSNNLANYRVMFVDDENRIYGFEGGVTAFPIEGVPLGGVAVGGQEFETQDNPASLTLTLYINDYADFLANLRNVQVDYDIVDAIKGAGLDWVDISKEASGSDSHVSFLMHFGGENITSIVWDMISAAGTPLTVFKAMFSSASAATAVAYDSSTNTIEVTGCNAVGSLTDPEGLEQNLIYGIEEWVD